MIDRTTVRTVATLVAALCVTTMFAGSAAALDLGSVGADDSSESPVDVNTDLVTEAGQDGGSGEGGVAVESDSGGGSASVDANPEDGINLTVRGGGSVQDQGVSGGVNCDIPAGQPEDPSTICQPIGDSGAPIPPENSTVPPENFLPEDSPISPEDSPISPEKFPPTSGLDGLQAL